MTQVQIELSDHSEDVKAVSIITYIACGITRHLIQYLTAISDPRGGQQCSLSDMVYREG